MFKNEKEASPATQGGKPAVSRTSLSIRDRELVRELSRLIGLEFRAALAEDRARSTTTNNFN